MFIIRGFIWDIPILNFCLCAFWGPSEKVLFRVLLKGFYKGSLKGSIRDP